jgi:hypothetical protein
MSLLAVFLSILFASCASVYLFDDITIPQQSNQEECTDTVKVMDGDIKVNTTTKRVRLYIPGQGVQKFRIKDYRYKHRRFTLFPSKSSREGITIETESGHELFILYKSFCKLTFPADNDDNPCNDYIYYGLFKRSHPNSTDGDQPKG